MADTDKYADLHLALESGNVRQAQRLLDHYTHLSPDDPELKRIARIIALPVIKVQQAQSLIEEYSAMGLGEEGLPILVK